MDTEDSMNFPATSVSGGGNMLKDGPCETGCDLAEADFVSLESEVREVVIVDDHAKMSGGYLETSKLVLENEVEKVLTECGHSLPLSSELIESTAVVKGTFPAIAIHTEDKSLTSRSLSSLCNHENGGKGVNTRDIDSSPSAHLSGVKRSRVTFEEHQPSVFIVYKYLNRDSKQKLEELLREWSQWHALNCPSSHDLNDSLESGEETYFPALRINSEKPSAVSFWVDNQIKNQSNKLTSLDDTSVPLYNRGYSSALTSSSSLNGGLEDLDASRCFNCGSYSHTLKDCGKPRDNVAVNNARKQHNSKRGQRTSSQRYYESSRGGKYDGLVPGVLDSKTRQLLGLRDLDPPPWLNRMREIGYPPGYLEQDENEKDQPSGITIFGDEVPEETEDGEISGAGYSNPPKKMSVEFPGINAPIPEEADERLWAPRHLTFNQSGARSQHRHKPPSEDFSRGYHHSRGRYDFDDDGPPGCEPGTSPSLSNYSRRYGDPDPIHGSISPYASPRHWSSTSDRSMSDRNRRSPFSREDASPNHTSRGSLPYSYPRY